MVKKKKKLVIILSLVLAVILAAGGALMYVFKDSIFPEKTFTVSGVVTIDGSPASNFTVSSNKGDAVTDENGRYTFSELTGEITISVSDDIYYFNAGEQTFSTDSTCDFNGRKYRDVMGSVYSGNSVVPFAKVTIVAENGVYETYSDENGEFEVPNVVGKVTISAEKDGMHLFDKVLNSKETEATIRATSDYVLEFDLDVDSANWADAGVKVKFGVDYFNITDGRFVLEDAHFGDKLTIISTKYAFDVTEYVVTKENDVAQVKGYKIYTASGKVKSGDEAVSGVKVLIDGVEKAVTDLDGNYTIENLTKEKTISFVKDGFTFGNQTINAENSVVDMEILKKVQGKVTFEGKGQADVRVYTQSAETFTGADGKYYIETKLGEEIKFECEGYYLEGGATVDETLAQVNAISEKYYNLNLSVVRKGEPIDVKAFVDGIEYDVTNGVLVLNNLYRAKTLRIEKDGYIFDYPTTISRTNPNVVVEGQKLISINGTVGSGSLVLDGKVYLDGEFACNFTNGAFTIDNVLESGVVTVKCEGYDEFTKVVSDGDSQVTADLTYSITVSAKTGVNVVYPWLLTIDGESVEVEGEKVIDGLKGEVTLSFSKDFYTAQTTTVNKNANVTFSVTYTAKTTVLQNGLPVEGWKIILLDINTEDQVERTTDANGEVEFTGLDGEYVLFTINEQGVAFKPDSYLVSGGGIYNFSDSGYSFSGKITCGGAPLSGVKLVAQGKTVYTNENGEYSFEMLSADATLLISKTGYEFDKNGLDISDDVNGTEIDITATYTIFGKAISGKTAMEGVSVTLGAFNTVTDANGEYAFSGINVVGETLTFNKDGFVFANEEVNGYGEFNQNANVNLTLVVKSGDIILDGVTVKVNGGTADKYYLGDIITFEKAGYVFESVTVTSAGSIEVNGTYTVTGKVINGENELANAIVVVNGQDYLTTPDGFFTISGVDGENVITAKYGEFEFTISTVNGPCAIEVVATYTANFTVTCGIDPLANALIKIGGKEVYTDSEGKATVSGLSGKNNVEIIKDGYTITGDDRIAGAGTYAYTSTYAISGKVTCVNSSMSGVTVQSGAKIVNTNANGEFTVSGLTGVNEFTVSLSGYESQTFTVSAPDYKAVSLRYNVIINFVGVADCSGITVKYNGTEITTENNSTLTLGYFDSATRIELSKDGYGFTPATINVSKHATYQITVEAIYSITGTITTQGGTPVVGYRVTAGDREDYTDANGYYEISGLKGTNQINGAFPISSGNCAMTPFTISSAGNYDFNSIKDADYAKGLFLNGYNNLLIGQSYEIIGLGDVAGKSMGVTKNTKSGVVKRKDTKGNIVTENINYGSQVLGIDPSVATMSFYNASTNSIKYKRLKDGDKNGTINSNLDGSYNTVSWSTWTPEQYLSNMGNPVTGALPYNLSASTMQSVSTVAKKNGAYEISFNLDVNNQANYKKQTEFLASGSGASFKSIKLTVTINLNGFITKVIANENYNITVDGFDADTTTTMTFNITMPSFDFRIADIDVDNNLSTALNKKSSMEVK